ncbi:hypothetical protein GCM10027184_59390 [Saccharothrix stipae]
MTNDTRARDTPARAATSSIVGLATGASLLRPVVDRPSGKRALDTGVTDVTALERSNK